MQYLPYADNPDNALSWNKHGVSGTAFILIISQRHQMLCGIHPADGSGCFIQSVSAASIQER